MQPPRPDAGSKVCGSFFLSFRSFLSAASGAPRSPPHPPPPKPPSRPHQPFPRMGGRGGGTGTDTFLRQLILRRRGNATRRTAADGMRITPWDQKPKGGKKKNGVFSPLFCQLSPYLLCSSHPTMVTLPRSRSVPFKYSLVVSLLLLSWFYCMKSAGFDAR